MNWEAIGAIGEILGAVAVFVSLFYLALQIRRSNLQSRAAMVQSLSAEFAKSNDAVSLSSDLADLFAKSAREEPLTDSERWRLQSLMNRNLNTYLAVQKAYDSGQLDQDYFDTICDDIRRMSKSPGWATALKEILEHFPNERDKEIFRSLYNDEAAGS